MKSFSKIFLFSVLILSVASCKLSREDAAKDADKYLSEANQNLMAGKTDTFAVSQAVFYVNQFTREFPGDTLGSKLMMRLGNLHQGMRSYQKAIDVYLMIDSLYPKSSDGANAIFSAAYIYGNSLYNIKEAKALYIKYLDEYPDYNAKMSDDAKFEMETLGMTPDQQFDLIMKRSQQKDSTASASK